MNLSYTIMMLEIMRGGGDNPSSQLLPINENLEAFKAEATIRYTSRQTADNTSLILELVDKKNFFTPTTILMIIFCNFWILESKDILQGAWQ